jgi:periplasmic mercuric ion binding protein
MKILFKSMLFSLFLFFISNNSIAQEKKSTGKVVIKTTLNCDHCKACETCGLKFKTEMLKIKGVKMYELDDKKMTFTVYFNPKKTDLQTIKIAISKMGFDADEVKADPIAYQKLDDCCKV